MPRDRTLTSAARQRLERQLDAYLRQMSEQMMERATAPPIDFAAIRRDSELPGVAAWIPAEPAPQPRAQPAANGDGIEMRFRSYASIYRPVWNGVFSMDSAELSVNRGDVNAFTTIDQRVAGFIRADRERQDLPF